MDYEAIALTCINKRIDDLFANKYNGHYWLMKNGWEIKEAEKLSIKKDKDTIKEIANEIKKASGKYLKVVWIDRLYYMAIRKPIIDKRIKEIKQ